MRIRGKKWKVVECPRDAEWYGITLFDERAIYIAKGLGKKDLLETIVHESLHACYPDMCEEAVDEGAKSISKMIRKFTP